MYPATSDTYSGYQKNLAQELITIYTGQIGTHDLHGVGIHFLSSRRNGKWVLMKGGALLVIVFWIYITRIFPQKVPEAK